MADLSGQLPQWLQDVRPHWLSNTLPGWLQDPAEDQNYTGPQEVVDYDNHQDHGNRGLDGNEHVQLEEFPIIMAEESQEAEQAPVVRDPTQLEALHAAKRVRGKNHYGRKGTFKCDNCRENHKKVTLASKINVLRLMYNSANLASHLKCALVAFRRILNVERKGEMGELCFKIMERCCKSRRMVRMRFSITPLLASKGLGINPRCVGFTTNIPPENRKRSRKNYLPSY